MIKSLTAAAILALFTVGSFAQASAPAGDSGASAPKKAHKAAAHKKMKKEAASAPAAK
jgi:hypothetical protein